MTNVINPQKSEIWRVNLDPTVGQEINKIRPALVVSENCIGQLKQRIIIPITGWNRHYEQWPWMVYLKKSGNNGLLKDSAADASQIRSVSSDRFKEKLGTITKRQLDEILASIVLCVGYECPNCFDVSAN